MAGVIDRAWRLLRDHWLFALLLPSLLVLMTFPALRRVFESESRWMVGHDIDWHMITWDAWYAERILAGQADFFYTDFKFYPEGVSLAFHNHSVPHMFLLAGLDAFLPFTNAFNLAYLILIFLNALAAYVYLNHLFRDKQLATLGTVVFATCGFVLLRPSHPNNYFLATIPLSLYFTHRAVAEESLRQAALAGLLVGITAFTGMYTLACLLMILAGYVAVLVLPRWRMRRVWAAVLLLGLVAGGLTLLRFYPMLADSDGLSSAIAKGEDKERANDLLGNFINLGNSVTNDFFDALFPDARRLPGRGIPNDVYIGYIVMALALMAVIAKPRRATLAWLALALFFLILRLGAYLVAHGEEYRHIVLPKQLFVELFPHLFKPFWWNSNFYAGAVLPLAVLSVYGARVLLRGKSPERRLVIIVLLCGAVAFEAWQKPTQITLDDARLAYIEWLHGEDNQESIHVINLAMGGQPSKIYDYHQTRHGYPHVEGRPTRSPPEAFDYIAGNSILRKWRVSQSAHCLPHNRAVYERGLDQLLADGFSHVVLHVWLYNDEFVAPSFASVPAAYADRFVRVYRLAEMPASCANAFITGNDALPQYRQFALSDLAPDRGAILLGVEIPEEIEPALRDFYHSVFRGWLDAARLIVDEGEALAQRWDGGPIDALDQAKDAPMLLWLYDPSRVDERALATASAWIPSRFRHCQRLIATEDAGLDMYLDERFPCALTESVGRFTVEYDKGLQLTNLVAEAGGDALDLYMWWQRLPLEAPAFSLQVFNAAGDKVHQQDHVIKPEPFMRLHVELSGLSAGAYSARLIVYDYATGASFSGRRAGDASGFERELEVASFALE